MLELVCRSRLKRYRWCLTAARTISFTNPSQTRHRSNRPRESHMRNSNSEPLPTGHGEMRISDSLRAVQSHLGRDDGVSDHVTTYDCGEGRWGYRPWTSASRIAASRRMRHASANSRALGADLWMPVVSRTRCERFPTRIAHRRFSFSFRSCALSRSTGDASGNARCIQFLAQDIDWILCS